MNVIDFLVVYLSLVSAVHGNLNEMLHYYETLGEKDIHVHSLNKRSFDQEAESSPIQNVAVNAFSRTFHLILKHHRDFLSPDFQVVRVDGHGRETPVYVNHNDFFTGHVEGEVRSNVEAYWENGTLTANIQTPEDEYTIEPSWRHLPNGNYSMVAYRTSDIKPDHRGKYVPSYCEAIKPEGGDVILDEGEVTYHHVTGNNPPYIFASNASQDHARLRRKRLTPVKNACPLMLVADYTFFGAVGQGSSDVTAKYLMHQIQKVDQIYSTTEFGSYRGMRMEVKTIKIHEAAQADSTIKHYNRNEASWQTRDLLEHFSKFRSHQAYCLVHLFTHRIFEKGVLGLAYIASPRIAAVGGMCTKLYRKDGALLSLNTGWSSSMNSFGNTLTSQQAYLVTAHELGHNWGSEHDPDKCAPSAGDNGKYIMYPYAVAGYDSNNKRFSPCSRNDIAAVLTSKSGICFTEKLSYFCGNGMIDQNSPEECDAGYKGKNGNDNCCSESCKLKRGKICSDYNHGCCTNCQLSPSTKQCFSRATDDGTCLGNATCDGINPKCPQRMPLTDATPCGHSGKCKSGTCQVYCETIGKDPCACDDDANACKWCCRRKGTKTCLPEPKKNVYLEDGLPCVKGYCEKGVCKKTKQNLIVRIWNIIDKITIDQFVQFMRANIVGTVIVFSLFIWIPGSITISCLDKRREKKEKEKQEWRSTRNRRKPKPVSARSEAVSGVA